MLETVFVTGPDGLLGSNLVRELLSRNYKVKVMVQPGSASKTLEGLDVEAVACDLLDKEKLVSITAGADYIMHVAAITNVWPSRGEIYHKVNVEGTRNMMHAARQNNVKRFVYVGSASSFGFGTKESPGNEDSEFRSAKYGLDYIDTKRNAQIEVIAAAKEGFPAIVVNPTFMIGPYDYKPSSGAMIVNLAKGKVPGASKGGKNWVAVKDVAVGAANALTMGRIGECYILGGENLSYKEAFDVMAKVLGVSPPKREFPNFLTKTTGRMFSMISAISGKQPKLSYPMAAIACDGHYFSPQKAIDELGLPQMPLAAAVTDAVEWFKANNYI